MLKLMQELVHARLWEVQIYAPAISHKMLVGQAKRHMAVVTPALIENVKARLLENRSNYALIGLIQLNTGMRLSEPVFARVEDCILDHPIPHLWILEIGCRIVRRNRAFGRYLCMAYLLKLLLLCMKGRCANAVLG